MEEKIEKLKEAIKKYYECNFFSDDSESDFENLNEIPLCFSTIDITNEDGKEEERWVQVDFDLPNLTILKYMEEKGVVLESTFDSIDEAIEFFDGLEFDYLLYM